MELDNLRSADTAVSFTGRYQNTATSINKSKDPEKSDPYGSQDESVLARFGKKQQLKVMNFMCPVGAGTEQLHSDDSVRCLLSA